MPQYLLSVHSSDEDYASPESDEMQATFEAVDTFNNELQAAGQWVFGGGLQPASSATVVKAEGGAVATTDGPYAETKEYLGGFWVIEVGDLDAALALAGKASEACRNPVEVRPFQDEPEA